MNERIDTLFAFIAVDDDGSEGVMAFMSPEGWMPMVGADEARINSLKPIAQQMSSWTKKQVVLTRFTAREDVELIVPGEVEEGTVLFNATDLYTRGDGS